MAISDQRVDGNGRRFEFGSGWAALRPGTLPGTWRLQLHASDVAEWSALHDHAIGVARAAGAPRIVSVVREDDPQVERLTDAGYELGWRSWGAELVLADDLEIQARPVPPGITVRELTIQDAPTAYRTYARAVADFPQNPATSAERHDEPGFTSLWRDHRIFGAMESHDRCVGLTVSTVEGDVVDTTFTMIDAERRGLGLATVVKQLMIETLHGEGARTFRTGGAEVSRAMLAVNRRLGYRLEPWWLTFVRDVG